MDVTSIGQLLPERFPWGTLDELVEQRNVDIEAVDHIDDGWRDDRLVGSVIQMPSESLQSVVDIEIVAGRTHGIEARRGLGVGWRSGCSSPVASCSHPSRTLAPV